MPAAPGICNRSGIGKVRHITASQLVVQYQRRDRTSELCKCRSDFNPADITTKDHVQVQVNQCLVALGIRAESGRAASAPRLAAEVEACVALVVGVGPTPATAGPASASAGRMLCGVRSPNV